MLTVCMTSKAIETCLQLQLNDAYSDYNTRSAGNEQKLCKQKETIKTFQLVLCITCSPVCVLHTSGSNAHVRVLFWMLYAAIRLIGYIFQIEENFIGLQNFKGLKFKKWFQA